MIQKYIATARAVGEWFASPYQLFFALPWLMVLLVFGTIAQRYVGLYQSEKLFFGSFIFWIGPIPAPGAYLVLAFIAISLVAKLVLHSPLHKQEAGIILAHISVLLLLVGGMISALTREEGYMMLAEGEQSNQVQDYQRHEVSIRKNGVLVAVIPEHVLRIGTVLLPSPAVVKAYCHNCSMNFTSLPSPTEEEERRPALQATVDGKTYLISEAEAEPATVTLGKDQYSFTLQHEMRTLPVALQLQHFDKQDYPGTAIARSYESDVVVKDGLLSWNADISMNTPLRTHGYTFYQSSFLEQDGKHFTVLAVVRNTGAWFPYIAVTLLCTGLGLHAILIALRRRSP